MENKLFKNKFFLICVFMFIGATAFIFIKKNHTNEIGSNAVPIQAIPKNQDTQAQNSTIKTNSDNFDYNKNLDSTAPLDTTANSNDPYSYYDKAKKESLNNDFVSALNDINKAIIIDNKNANFYIEKAEIQIKMNQKDQSISTITNAQELLPNNNLLNSELEILKSK